MKVERCYEKEDRVKLSWGEMIENEGVYGLSGSSAQDPTRFIVFDGVVLWSCDGLLEVASDTWHTDSFSPTNEKVCLSIK